MRCTVCASPQVNEVDVLLGSGSSIRKVARIHGIPRTTLARHARHIAPASTPFGVIRGTDGPSGPPDPLAEALLLAERARTPRERLRALEQVRAATKLRLRGLDPDAEDRGLLNDNVSHAEAAYRDAPDFETAARALSGWREAIIQRLDAVVSPAAIEVPVVVMSSDGTKVEGPFSGPGTWRMRPEDYWRGVPKRFRDPGRFVVRRTIKLRWTSDLRGGGRDEEIGVYEAGDVLVWSK
jgi:hypothetical protein